MCIANIVLNKAPNSNDAMRVASNVRLTIMGALNYHGCTTILNSGYIAITHAEKLTYQRQEK